MTLVHRATRPVTVALLGLTAALSAWATPAPALEEDEIRELSWGLFSHFGDRKQVAIDALVTTGDRSLIPTFVLALRWAGDDIFVADALSTLTGERLATWHAAFEWQEAHPEITPHPTYRDVKLHLLRGIDERFMDLLDTEAARANAQIRFEEITWGGAKVDDIPPLDAPKMLSVENAGYLRDEDLVFGVSINGDARAYPLRVLGWHEMMNDVIGGVPVALAYCTLCGAGILFETDVDGRAEPFVFGSSGLLYRSNKLMFDRQTETIWNQFTGKPVIGELVGSGIALKQRPILVASWKDWREANPTTTVLSDETGFLRDYGPGVVYSDYFASPDLMFPALVGDESRLKRKDYVFGVRAFAASKAWPLDVFEGGAVINDRIGDMNIVLIGDAATRTVRAYDRGDLEFRRSADGDQRLLTSNGAWTLREDALTGPDGAASPRIPGHISYWFAWNNYLGLRSELYDGE